MALSLIYNCDNFKKRRLSPETWREILLQVEQ
jgi:hypothetical protein